MPRDPLPIGGLGHISLRRTTDGWIATSRFRDTDGVVRQIKARGATKAKAENRLKANAERRSPNTGQTLTGNTKVTDAATKWLGLVQGAPSTLVAYRRAVESHVVPSIGAIRLNELRTSTIQAMLDTLTEKSGPATARQARNVTMQILDMCARDDAIPTNPAVTTTLRRTAAKTFTALTAEDIAAIREHVIAWGKAGTYGPPRPWRLLLDFVDVLAGTGARPGEVLALRWQDVDLETGSIRISGTLVRTGGKLVRQPAPKTDKSNRELRLPGTVVQVLRARRRNTEGGPDSPVFASRVGGWIEASNLQSRWTKAREGGWEHVTFRDYRKAVATLLKRVEGIEAAAAQLGHSSPEVTRKHYVERDGVVDFASVIDW